MQGAMAWDEIKKQFPNEWVAVVQYEQNGAIGVNGVVATHSPERKTFYVAMRNVRMKHKDVAVRYTGKLIKNTEMPLLWQITHTTSKTI